MRAMLRGCTSAMSVEKRYRMAVRLAVVADAGEIARLSAQFGHPVAMQDLRMRIAMLSAMPSQYLAVAQGQGREVSGWIQVEHRLVLAAATALRLSAW
jgi:hypothetical protein